MANVGVPLLDLKAQFDSISDELLAVVERVVRSQQFILGPEVEGMEREVADYCSASHCLGVSSGSDALLLVLMAMGIGRGDEVITTPFSFFATAGAIARAGATPVFADIDPETYNLDPAAIEANITPRTRAILPVHLFGQCADMAPIQRIAARRGLAVIEDAAQAIGAEYQGARAGTLGDVACFSFFPSKNLGAFGDGGAVTTNDPRLDEVMRCLRVHGEKTRYHHQLVGANFRLDALQAAVLRVKLHHLDSWTKRRQENARIYEDLFADRGLAGQLVQTPVVREGRHIFNQYVIRVVDRDRLRDALTTRRIGTQIYYPVPLHLQECFAYLGHQAGAFPESEKAANETIALPIYPELNLAQQEEVVGAIAEFYSSSASRRRAA